MDPDEEVSLDQSSDDEDETLSSITAAIALHESQRPLSAMSSSGASGARASKRKRTCSRSATISTEREPIIRTNRRTIYTAGRPPW